MAVRARSKVFPSTLKNMRASGIHVSAPERQPHTHKQVTTTYSTKSSLTLRWLAKRVQRARESPAFAPFLRQKQQQHNVCYILHKGRKTRFLELHAGFSPPRSWWRTHRRLPHLSDAEIPELDHSRARQENILRLEVAVQYPAVVDMLKCESRLDEPGRTEDAQNNALKGAPRKQRQQATRARSTGKALYLYLGKSRRAFSKRVATGQHESCTRIGRTIIQHDKSRHRWTQAYNSSVLCNNFFSAHAQGAICCVAG